MEEVVLQTVGLVVVGSFLLGWIVKNKNKLKKTILRRLTGEEKD